MIKIAVAPKRLANKKLKSFFVNEPLDLHIYFLVLDYFKFINKIVTIHRVLGSSIICHVNVSTHAEIAYYLSPVERISDVVPATG